MSSNCGKQSRCFSRRIQRVHSFGGRAVRSLRRRFRLRQRTERRSGKRRQLVPQRPSECKPCYTARSPKRENRCRRDDCDDDHTNHPNHRTLRGLCFNRKRRDGNLCWLRLLCGDFGGRRCWNRQWRCKFRGNGNSRIRRRCGRFPHGARNLEGAAVVQLQLLEFDLPIEIGFLRTRKFGEHLRRDGLSLRRHFGDLAPEPFDMDGLSLEF